MTTVLVTGALSAVPLLAGVLTTTALVAGALSAVPLLAGALTTAPLVIGALAGTEVEAGDARFGALPSRLPSNSRSPNVAWPMVSVGSGGLGASALTRCGVTMNTSSERSCWYCVLRNKAPRIGILLRPGIAFRSPLSFSLIRPLIA